MIFALLLLIAFNLYSIFLLPQIDWFDLFYFDLLVIVVWLACVLSARFRRRRREQEIKKRLGDKGLAAPAFFLLSTRNYTAMTSGFWKRNESRRFPTTTS